MMLKVDLKRKLKENGIEVEGTVNDSEKFGDIVRSMINNGKLFYLREIRGWICYVQYYPRKNQRRSPPLKRKCACLRAS